MDRTPAFTGGLGNDFWKVTEPTLNLWLIDRSMFYTKSHGKRQSFKLAYKQRNSRSNPNSFGLGPFWDCNRLSYFQHGKVFCLNTAMSGVEQLPPRRNLGVSARLPTCLNTAGAFGNRLRSGGTRRRRRHCG